jgi:hypothetical protein
MFKTAAILVSAICFALPAMAQEKEPPVPKNTIDCRQFKKTGSQEWIEVGTAVFDLGSIGDIHLSDQPVTPRAFKFGGIDLYPVLEQKCGAAANFNRGNSAQAKGEYGKAIAEYNEALRLDPKLVGATVQRVFALQRLVNQASSKTAAPEPVASEQTAAVPKPDLEQDKVVPAPAQTHTQANINELVSSAEKEIIKSGSESGSCGNRTSVYVADGLTGAENGRDLIEIVFDKQANDEEKHSEFVMRAFRDNKPEWSYRGKTGQKNDLMYLVFTPVNNKAKRSFGSYIFATAHSTTKKPVMLALNYIRPNRNGTGEPILYLSGLRTLFASKENRFKLEGKPPVGSLPEAFYFDRCE